jgi:hypothetical protein
MPGKPAGAQELFVHAQGPEFLSPLFLLGRSRIAVDYIQRMFFRPLNPILTTGWLTSPDDGTH